MRLRSYHPAKFAKILQGDKNASSLCSKIISTLGSVHKLRLQEEGGRWSKKYNFGKLLCHRKCKRRGVDGQKKPKSCKRSL